MSAHTPGPHVPESCHVEQCPECAPIFAAREKAERRSKLPVGDSTPGPWQYAAEGRGYDVRTVTAGIGEPIARRVMRCPDARLIAQAPAMYGFIRELVERVSLHPHREAQARAILAAVEGK